MRFTKMHGLGNDYVYVDGFANTIDAPENLAVRVADRHFGIGGDGLIIAAPPEAGVEADARMRMFNADGSESEMCGNGIRCVCKLVHDHKLGPNPTANPMKIQTGNGVLSLEYTLDADGNVDTVAVDMGAPILDLPAIPVDESKIDARLDGAQFVSMGNPHVVIYVDDDRPLEDPMLGAELERHPAFPNRINVHFVRVKSRSEVEVYHWERGSGATLACGTGACAVCVAGVLSGRTDRTLTAHLPGGPLKLEWLEADGSKEDSGGGHVIMTGPATEVFTGDWPAD
ncbi:MAG: diaminopimelate epimerase [Planctomycetota bacterium]